MKKTIFSLMAFAAVSSAFAGGLLTNTNQNAAFVRNFALEGKTELTSIYANPAGGAFITNGWHLSLNCQTAFQERNIETTYPLFVNNINNRNETHRYEGKATAPVVPSFTVSYNKDKWSISSHFAITGGGGKCEFDKGLGSFENIGARIPSAVTSGIAEQLTAAGYPPATAAAMAQQLGPDSYSINSSMKGRSYYFGLQLGATYKFAKNVSGYLGIRGIYASCSYSGFVDDLTLSNSVTGATAVNGTSYIDLVRNTYQADPTIDLNCDQTGFGATIILGVDWMINKHWNVSAKYEGPTRINLKNSSQMSKMAQMLAKTKEGEDLGQFEDGKKVREDVPALLALGVQYSPIEKVRIDAAYHQFFDKVSTKYLDKQDLINHNTHEFLLGAEWDICKWLTISGSWEITSYGLSDDYMKDLSYSLSNNMIGGGFRIHATKKLNFDLGYMCTFYNSRNVSKEQPAGSGYIKTDHYERKNHTFGIGVNLDF